jgi:uncharacterized membrane protein
MHLFEPTMTRPMSVFFASVTLAVGVLTLVVASPWLAAHGYPVAAALIYQAFSPLCHQVSSRSFHLDGIPFAVCARCTGVYLGAVVGLLIYPLRVRIDNETMPSRVLLMAGVAPLAIDGLANLTRIYSSSMNVRAATGVITGVVVAWFILPGLVSIAGVSGKRGPLGAPDPGSACPS